MENRPVPLLALGVVSGVLFAMFAVKAQAKPFWLDEIYTILFSKLPSIPAMWSAARQGLDLQPPLNAFVTHGVHTVARVGLVTTRMPAMFGYWIMIVVTFVIVLKRSNATLALSAALLPAFTAAFRYGYEARGYGLMMGLAALALYFWSEAAAGRRRRMNLPLLAAALAAGLWNQYYAVLVFLPLGAGELVRLIARRRPDWPMWLASGAALVAALPLLPVARIASSQSAGYWAPARWTDVSVAYGFLFESLLDPKFLWATAIILVVVALGFFTRRGRPWLIRDLPSHEVAAGIAWLLMPLFGVLLGIFVTGAFVPRYVLSSIVGAAVAIPLVVFFLSRGPGFAEIVLLAALALTFGQSAYQSLVTARLPFRDPVATRPMLLSRLSGTEPVVVTGTILFLQLWYYTPSELQNRIVYLADPAAARHYMGTDTTDLGYLVLRRYAPVPIQDYGAFVAAHREFCVYAGGSGWVLDKLRDSGASIEEVGREPGAIVYAVRVGH